MPDKAAQFIINEVNESLVIGQVSSNVSGVIYDAEMGPVNDASTLITNDLQFRRVFGGVKPDKSNFNSYTQCIRALKRGSALRICSPKNTPLDADAGPTKTYTIASALVSGDVITATFGLSETVSETFAVSSTATLEKFMLKLKQSAAVAAHAKILYTKVISGTKFIVVSSDDTALGVVFTVTPTKAITVTTSNAIENAEGDPLFAFVPKYPGAKYNDITIFITPNVQGGYFFDLTIQLLNSVLPTEKYIGLSAANYDAEQFLEKVKNSNIVTPSYLGTTLTGPAIPVETFLKYAGGSDGSALTASDLIGTSVAKTGVFAFDGYDDVARIASVIDYEALSITQSAVEPSLADYAASKKTLVHFALLHGMENSEDVIAERQAWGINSSYSRLYADGSGLIVVDPNNPKNTLNIPALGDILGCAAYSAANYKPWFSYANQNRGTIVDNIGVKNSWGDSQDSLDAMAKYQINTVINRNKLRMVWGNFTAQYTNDLLSFCNIRDLLIYMKKALIPLAGPFIEEPNDIPTWKAIYQKVQPWILRLQDDRAITEGKWYGDQDANSMANLVINDPDDVQQGKYLAKFLFKPINSLQFFEIDLTITASSVSFEELIPTT